MRIAVLDLGSNTFHLLVALASPDGRLTRLDRRKEQVRIGEGSSRIGAITRERWAKGMEAAAALGRCASRHPGVAGVAVATSAIREAKNGRAFLDGVRRATGFRVEMLSGEAEARLVYRGARAGLEFDPGRIAVIDLGGGSTEVVVGEGDRCLGTWSLPIGTLRMKARYCRAKSGVLGADGAAALRAEVAGLVSEVAKDVRRLEPDTFVLTSGTARALRRLANDFGLGSDFKRRIGLRAAEKVARRLTGLAPSDISALGVPRMRSDTVAPGSVALCALLDAFDASAALVSRTALREGVVLREWEASTATRSRALVTA